MKIEVGRIGLGCAAIQWEGIPRWHLPMLENPEALGEGVLGLIHRLADTLPIGKYNCTCLLINSFF